MRGSSGSRPSDLTTREREIIGKVAAGMSGAEIASELVLSPETVRTHIRNAMTKLGASTRSQAVVLAMEQGQIAGSAPPARRRREPAPARRRADNGTVDAALQSMLDDLCLLPDVDGAVVLLAEEDGLSLRRAALAAAEGSGLPQTPTRVALGEGALGKVALNRRAAVLPSLKLSESHAGSAVAAPLLASGQLLGVLGLATRTSRPTGQDELLVLQAFVGRIAEILLSGDDLEGRLEATVKRFGASWSAATG